MIAAEDVPLTWGDPIAALKWSIQTLDRVQGYARSGVVPPHTRGVGVPWNELEQLALTISAAAHEVEPAIAARMLRAICAGPEAAPLEFALATIDLDRQARRVEPEVRRLDPEVSHGMALVAMLRLTHETAKPRHRRHPPLSWYARAAKIRRQTIYRHRWHKVRMAFEETARAWRDSAANGLKNRLERVGIVE